MDISTSVLLERDIIHADETPCQVLKEDGKTAQSRSYMWLYGSGNDGLPPIRLYDYQPSRGGYHAEEFLKGFSGYLICDGFSGYNKLKGVIRVRLPCPYEAVLEGSASRKIQEVFR